MITRSKKMSEKGQSLVELALVLPIVLIILFGIMEFGRIFSAYLMVSNASREGARYASIGKADAQNIADIQTKLSSLGSVSVDIGPDTQSSRAYGDEVTVTVTHDLKLIVPIVNKLISDTSTMKIEVDTSMRIEIEIE